MIDELSTFLCFNYYSDELSFGSNKRVWAVCENCGKYRLLKFCRIADLCGSCAHIDKKPMLGKQHSEKTRANMRKNRIGKNAPMFGKRHTDETKRKISKSQIGKKCPYMSGENHPNWNSNLTDEDRQDKRNYSEYKEWRIAVYERDKYTCQICGISGTLNAHHLEGYANNPSLRIKLNNGITLCKECHDNFHHKYTRHNNTKEQFIEFIGGN